jgi:hypothetical protein
MLVLIASGCDFYGTPYPTRPSGEPSLGAGARNSGPEGGAGTRATAGNAGASGNQRLPGTLDAMVAPPPVACGDNVCVPPSDRLAIFLSGLRNSGLISVSPPTPAACCLEPKGGVCGITPFGGGSCEPLPVPDDRCLAIDLRRLGTSARGLERPACCIDGMCGQDQTLIGRGCVENSQVWLQLKSVPFIGSLAQVPPPRRCDAPPAPDAGPSPVEDASRLEDAGTLEDAGALPDASGAMNSIPG